VKDCEPHMVSLIGDGDLRRAYIEVVRLYVGTSITVFMYSSVIDTLMSTIYDTINETDTNCTIK